VATKNTNVGVFFLLKSLTGPREIPDVQRTRLETSTKGGGNREKQELFRKNGEIVLDHA